MTSTASPGRGPNRAMRGPSAMRLDSYLSSSGLAHSRSQAVKLIRGGSVRVNDATIRKPSHPVSGTDRVSVDAGEQYVSRGAYKLLAAFQAFASSGLPSPHGRDCLDIGASTGGFCDVLLRGGASRVIALDVGHGQLDPRIAHDARITEMSGVNIRSVTRDRLPYAPQMVVSDVSFISLTYVIPVISRIAAAHADVVLLVKPQFEVGRGRLGKHGVVRDAGMQDEAVDTVRRCAIAHGMQVVGTVPSAITGMHGNKEFLLYARLR